MKLEHDGKVIESDNLHIRITRSGECFVNGEFVYQLDRHYIHYISIFGDIKRIEAKKSNGFVIGDVGVAVSSNIWVEGTIKSQKGKAYVEYKKELYVFAGDDIPWFETARTGVVTYVKHEWRPLTVTDCQSGTLIFEGFNYISCIGNIRQIVCPFLSVRGDVSCGVVSHYAKHSMHCNHVNLEYKYERVVEAYKAFVYSRERDKEKEALKAGKTYVKDYKDCMNIPKFKCSIPRVSDKKEKTMGTVKKDSEVNKVRGTAKKSSGVNKVGNTTKKAVKKNIVVVTVVSGSRKYLKSYSSTTGRVALTSNVDNARKFKSETEANSMLQALASFGMKKGLTFAGINLG